MIHPTYTLLMIAAVVVAGLVSRKTQASLNLEPRLRLAIGLGAFCGAMLGAKLPFVLYDWSGLLDGSAWFANGKTILCGLVGGYCGVEATKWMLDIQVKTGDAFAVPVALAISIGRLACFSAGCCFGKPTTVPWGVVFPSVDLQHRHPTQLYEAAFHLAAAAVLYFLLARGMFRGQLIKLYFLSYFVYRLGSEFIRPEPQLWSGLTAYQWACLFLIPLFAGLWAWDVGRMRKAHAVRPETRCQAPDNRPGFTSPPVPPPQTVGWSPQPRDDRFH